ncbi:hypothetical protein XM38_010310 [Halomicronema hongdechloris C2206]|uniref:Uncharacterized protein n=1 Tax=Halomicronema hongdechloris C2206 TaxID=1641165 RepID=A0A1Z3HIH8_9CYAN|nr:hypothetical protein [Halomicronema hongdechloris]ASC70101.1 hypothetical protein XM38_010310 [Halomicronema hongdechloris C2206]
MFEAFSPRQITPEQSIESLELHQIAHDFRQEIEYRDQFEHYCRWYTQVSRQHQRELAAMATDIDLFGWFWRRRTSR